MLMLWELGPSTVREIVAQMPEPKPHINTVSTFLHILQEKGYVAHEHRKHGYKYYATVPVKEYRDVILDKALRAFGGEVTVLVDHLVQTRRLSVAELETLIEQRASTAAE